MNLGGEAADQVVRYSLEGLDHGLRLSGTMAKNLAVFFAALLKSNQKSYGKICMARMLKENRPLKFFTVPASRIHEFAKEGKKRGLPYVVIRDRKNPDQCELMVFADDAAKVNRVMDKMNLDFLKSENGLAIQEVEGKENIAQQKEGTQRSGQDQEAPNKPKDGMPDQENPWQDIPANPVQTETVEMPEGDVQFEFSDMEEDFNIGDLMGGMENFTQAQEERNPSGTSSRSRDISSVPGKGNEKPSVRRELEQIKKEKQEAGRRQKQKNRSRGNRRTKKRTKSRGKGR
ncbi:hypothetical protein C817_02151 [Dorea sp. 5-2]|nr:hypothetical protein C817_02151 [Dorea sp. 5-2]